MPPVDPMLAKVAPEIPPGLRYEPKWDGFRTVVFRDGDEVELGSRNTKPMQRYFPEVVAAVLADLPERCVVDGEIVVPSADGTHLDFEALLQRVHPAASRVRLLAEQTPARLVLWDVLALGDDDLRGLPSTPVQKVHNMEVGFKYQADWIYADISAYRKLFYNVPYTITYGDGSQFSFDYASATKGINFDTVIKPFAHASTASHAVPALLQVSTSSFGPQRNVCGEQNVLPPSFSQVAEQPSSDIVLPSSHCSP